MPWLTHGDVDGFTDDQAAPFYCLERYPMRARLQQHMSQDVVGIAAKAFFGLYTVNIHLCRRVPRPFSSAEQCRVPHPLRLKRAQHA